jgi:hypothetical protein
MRPKSLGHSNLSRKDAAGQEYAIAKRELKKKS